MDRTEQHLQSLGICQRLHNFIMRILASQAFKTVKLGSPMNQAMHDGAGTKRDCKMHPEAQETSTNRDHSIDGAGTKRDCKVHPEAQETSKNIDHSIDGDANNNAYANPEKSTEEEGKHGAPTIARQAKPPKKMVSISDKVEDIEREKAMKLRQKSKSFEKLNWLVLAKEEPKPKPVRSILKTGSDLSKQITTFANNN